MELDKSERLEMLSREDLQALSKCIPTDLDAAFKGFHSSNWFRHDNSKFSEANNVLKSMYAIHEEWDTLAERLFIFGHLSAISFEYMADIPETYAIYSIESSDTP